MPDQSPPIDARARIGHVHLKVADLQRALGLALYLRDPDQNGVELYWDRPREQWPRTAKGELAMITKPLDMDDLLKETDENLPR